MTKKFFGKLNILDIILIIIIILSIIGIVYKFSIGDSSSNLTEIIMSFKCESYPSGILNDVSTGQSCIDGDNGALLGTVKEFKTENLKTDGYSELTLDSSVSAIDAASGVLINDNAYIKGKKLNLIVGDVIFPVYISDIKFQ